MMHGAYNFKLKELSLSVWSTDRFLYFYCTDHLAQALRTGGSFYTKHDIATKHNLDFVYLL